MDKESSIQYSRHDDQDDDQVQLAPSSSSGIISQRLERIIWALLTGVLLVIIVVLSCFIGTKNATTNMVKQEEESVAGVIEKFKAEVGLTTAESPSDGCPPTWSRKGQSCYGVYHGPGNHGTWLDGKTRCQQMGASLLSIQSSKEQQYIKSLLNTLNVSYNMCSVRARDWWGFWTAGHDQGNEQQFVWDPSNESFTYTNWYGNNPSGNPSNDEDCMTIVKDKDWQWNDDACSICDHAFICEKQLSS